MLHDTLGSALGTNTQNEGSIPALPYPHGQAEVSRLLSVIAGQIADADRRQGEVLANMQSRLQQLGSDARAARPQVPNELVPAFVRIEDALSHLAQQIVETRHSREMVSQAAPADHGVTDDHPSATRSTAASSPMALRSASPASSNPNFNWAADFVRTRAETAETDTFDVVDTGGPIHSSDGWSDNDAEALTRVYEDAGHQVTSAPVQMAAPVMPQIKLSLGASPVPAATLVAAPLTHVPDLSALPPAPSVPNPAVAALAADRHWLETQFAGLAERLQESLSDAPAHDILASLDERLAQLERHLGLSLQDVATRSDVDGLKLVEAHIEEISRHLEQTQVQLGRLDGIESQLHEVVEHLAAQFENHPAAPGAGFAAEDFQRMAEEAAEHVANRFGSSAIASGMSATFAANDDQIASVRGLLESYITERRDGDEHHALMLDTLQQALIRVLDRIDTMEAAQAAATYNIAPIAAPPMAQAPAVKQHAPIERQRDMGRELPALEPLQAGPRPSSVAGGARDAMDEPGPFAPSLPEGAQTDERTGIDKLRQDFVADAQRAKQRASAAQAAAAAGAALDASPSRSRGSEAKTGAAKPAKKAAAGGSSNLRVVALAVLAVLAAGGLAKKIYLPSSASIAITTPAVTDATPEGDAAAPAASATGNPFAGSDTANPQGQPSATAPAETPFAGRPQASGPDGDVPATGVTENGMMFETDPDSGPEAGSSDGPVPAPSKISYDPAGPPPPGIRLRHSTEPVSPVNLAILQHQQTLANLSTQLGETAANTMTPASFMKEVPITALSPATAVTAQPGAISSQAKTTDARASALDLPPVTVGPLSLRLAAAKGDASAEFEAASRLAEGKGTAQNFKEALRWYQRSAAQGFAQAQYRLGTLYERGLGIKADTGTARSWYQRAADQGNVKAMHNLAVLSASRQSGPPDYATAAKWFRQAADRDLQDSQYNLGVLYESGLGVEKDVKQAMKWYSLAARGGDGESVRRRDLIKPQLAPQDLTTVSATVTAFDAIKVEDPLINDARAAGEDWKKRMDGQG